MENRNEKTLSNWGNYPKVAATVDAFSDEAALREVIKKRETVIPRGLGRCYGDSSLGEHVVSTYKFNKFIDFNKTDGTLTCESGVSLAEILEIFIPRGWFLPVTPGTRHVTVGGAVASDVHGKNHHKVGSFSRHILSLDVMLDSGEVVTCTPQDNRELFWATCGGMGLTGIILRASFRLIPIETAYIVQETVKARNIDEIMELFEESSGWTYTVAWIDCLARGPGLGRSILLRGEHAKKSELVTAQQKKYPLRIPQRRKLNIPFFLPAIGLNAFTVKVFNQLYYTRAADHAGRTVVDYENFFYPLDSVLNWNRIYGRRGFLQYQFMLPKAKSHEGITRVLEKVSLNRTGSFLAVLKLFGRQNDLISFPAEGYTLAMDFPVSEKTFNLFKELDEIVVAYGGRLYLTKDARMSADVFRAGYEKSASFIVAKHRLDKSNKFCSRQSKRLRI